ncbi:hypothetical protein TNCV_1163011 [Trichonephila clavipes]|nr:hypothetical protein TNCV_1163011 [Trichonephila clavipes]
MFSDDAVRINLNECMQKYDEYSERFFALLPVFGKKAVLEWYERRFDYVFKGAHTNSIEGRGVESNVSLEIRLIAPRTCLIHICMNLCGEGKIPIPLKTKSSKRSSGCGSVFPPCNRTSCRSTK